MQRCDDAKMLREDSDMGGMGKEAIWQMYSNFKRGCRLEEKQVERQGQQLGSMQEVQHQLQVKPLALATTLVQEGRVVKQVMRGLAGKGVLVSLCACLRDAAAAV